MQEKLNCKGQAAGRILAPINGEFRVMRISSLPPLRPLAALLLLGACAPQGPVILTSAPQPQATQPTLPNDIRWARNSAEHRALYFQVYRAATARASELASGMDADETVLDNSQYQLERAQTGTRYSEDTWNEWARRAAAPALPGAPEFIAHVRGLGGRVVIVTGRAQAVCADTRTNLTRLGMQIDAVLCTTDTSDKNPRFRAVAQGSAAPGLPGFEVLMWVGDNIRDFPDLTQDIRAGDAAAFNEFGRKYFLLPNPMYGSWERNP
jgi:5'-nucleotidase (lipoprotein e(P4) family)